MKIGQIIKTRNEFLTEEQQQQKREYLRKYYSSDAHKHATKKYYSNNRYRIKNDKGNNIIPRPKLTSDEKDIVQHIKKLVNERLRIICDNCKCNDKDITIDEIKRQLIL